MTEPFDDFDEDTPTTDAEDDGAPIDDPDPPADPDDPDVGIVVEIAANAAASSWTDLTDDVDLYGGGMHEALHAGGVAHRGEIGTGSGFDFEDDAASHSMPIKRPFRIRDTASSPNVVLLRGRVAEYTTGRGYIPAADERQFGVTLVDANAELRGIPIRKWTRPAETDIARMTALWQTFLKGSPRASTRLKPTYLRNANAVSMPAFVYENTDPYGVAADCAEAAAKELFVTEAHEIFYDLPTSTAYQADISITDDGPDGVDSFAPQWLDGEPKQAGGDEFLSGVVGTWSGGRVAKYRAAVEASHDYWREAVAIEAKSATDADKRVTAILDEHAREEVTYRVSIDLRSADIGRVRKGQTISFRAAAASILTPQTLRIGRLIWEPLSPQLYRAHLELSVPLKLGSRLPGGGATTPVDEGVVETDGGAPAGGLDRWNLMKEDGSRWFGPAAGLWERVDPDFDFGALSAPATSEVSKRVGSNISWPFTDCGVGTGGVAGLVTVEAWFKYAVDLADEDLIGVRFTITQLQGVVGMADGEGTIICGVATGADPTDKGQYQQVGIIGDAGGTVFVPRGLLIDDGDGFCWFVLAPAWHISGDLFFCNSAATKPDGYAEAGTDSAPVVSAVLVTLTGNGLTPWVSGIGDVDGTNDTFELAGWDGTGIPEVRIGAILLGAGEYTFDAGARTVTLNEPPEADDAGQLAFRYIRG